MQKDSENVLCISTHAIHVLIDEFTEHLKSKNTSALSALLLLKQLYVSNGKNNLAYISPEQFRYIVKQLLECICDKHPEARHDRYVSKEEAKRILNITSDSTLWALRTNGSIAFSQPSPKIILYVEESLYTYLKQHQRKTF